jgi:hypothetical protein
MKMQFYEHFLRNGKPAFEAMAQSAPPLKECVSCGFPSSLDKCGVCRVKEQLEA